LRHDIGKDGKTVKRVKIPGFKGKGMPEKCTARAVAIAHDDNTVVVGMKDGTV
jgi:hypothetical protein